MSLTSETTALIFQEYDVARQILKIQNYIFWNEIYLSLLYLSLWEEKREVYTLYMYLSYT